MKKLLLVLVLVLLATTLWAEYGKFGVGANIYVFNEKDTAPTNVVTKDNSFSIAPVFSIMVNEAFEVMPYVFYGSDTVKVDDVVTDKESSVGAGAGLYWHMVRTPHFRVMTGATIELGYSFLTEPAADIDKTFYIQAFFPIIGEVVLGDTISFRATLNVFTLALDFRTFDFGGGENKQRDFYFDTLNGIANIEFGIFFRFG